MGHQGELVLLGSQIMPCSCMYVAASIIEAIGVSHHNGR
jgi:hypothetical protein